MSKFMLVMDEPKSCDVCDFAVKDQMCGNLTCNNPLSEQYGHDVSDYIACRANGCPLRTVPEKQKHSSIDNEFQRGAKSGYNACIDEILKEES